MGITLFEHINFEGSSVRLENGRFNLGEQRPDLECKVSSFILDGRTSVTFSNYDLESIALLRSRVLVSYENFNQSPTRVADVGRFNDDWESLSVEMIPFGDFGPGTTQLDVEPGLEGIEAFVDWRFNSDGPRLGLFEASSQKFGPDEYNLPVNVSLEWSRGRDLHRRGIPPFSISSVKVGQGYCVELFDLPDFLGNKLTLVESCADIRSLNPAHYTSQEVSAARAWNDRVASLRVKKVLVA